MSVGWNLYKLNNPQFFRTPGLTQQPWFYAGVNKIGEMRRQREVDLARAQDAEPSSISPKPETTEPSA